MRLRRLLAVALVLAAGAGRAADMTTGRFDLGRSGFTAEKLAPPLALLWQFTTGEDKSYSSLPLVVGNRVFYCSLGNVYSLDAETGEVLWQFETRFVIRATPFYHDGKLFVCTARGELMVLDAADECEARLLNLIEAQGGLSSDPVLIGDLLYYVSDRGLVFSVNTKTYQKTDHDRFTSGPKQHVLLMDNYLLFTGTDNILYCWDHRRKRRLWSKTQGALVTPPARLDDSSVVVATRDGVRKVKLTSGNPEWVKPGITASRAAPTVAHNRIYIATRDAKILVLDPRRGDLVAETSPDWPMPTNDGVTIADTDLYVGTIDGNIYCLDAATLAARWYYRCDPMVTVGNEAPKYQVAFPPLVANGCLLAATTQGSLFCFRADAVDVGKPRLYLPQIATTAVDKSPWAQALYDDELRSAMREEAEAAAEDDEEPEIPVEAEQPKLPGKQPTFRFETYLYDEGSGVDLEHIRVTWDGQPYVHELIEAKHDNYLMVVWLIKPNSDGARQILANGDHTLSLTVPDFKGNLVKRDFTFTIDNSLPPLEPLKPKVEPQMGPPGAPGAGPEAPPAAP
ncbi:MAG: PQQ-binding-like beta-propeller repeat protein, partial [Armatimonadetes bacterium]|nr:PQQ-binding-like beta-propeller repeat protein [Armatimonadota bacterium]